MTGLQLTGMISDNLTLGALAEIESEPIHSHQVFLLKAREIDFEPKLPSRQAEPGRVRREPIQSSPECSDRTESEFPRRSQP